MTTTMKCCIYKGEEEEISFEPLTLPQPGPPMTRAPHVLEAGRVSRQCCTLLNAHSRQKNRFSFSRQSIASPTTQAASHHTQHTITGLGTLAYISIVVVMMAGASDQQLVLPSWRVICFGGGWDQLNFVHSCHVAGESHHTQQTLTALYSCYLYPLRWSSRLGRQSKKIVPQVWRWG